MTGKIRNTLFGAAGLALLATGAAAQDQTTLRVVMHSDLKIVFIDSEAAQYKIIICGVRNIEVILLRKAGWQSNVQESFFIFDRYLVPMSRKGSSRSRPRSTT